MTNTVGPIGAGTGAPSLVGVASASGAKHGGTSFLSVVDKALGQVSESQRVAHVNARDVVTGRPGASLETALVSAMRAKVEWGAAVAVRNGVVNAYKSIINMPV